LLRFYIVYRRNAVVDVLGNFDGKVVLCDRASLVGESFRVPQHAQTTFYPSPNEDFGRRNKRGNPDIIFCSSFPNLRLGSIKLLLLLLSIVLIYVFDTSDRGLKVRRFCSTQYRPSKIFVW